jgi:hypothetical protein
MTPKADENGGRRRGGLAHCQRLKGVGKIKGANNVHDTSPT